MRVISFDLAAGISPSMAARERDALSHDASRRAPGRALQEERDDMKRAKQILKILFFALTGVLALAGLTLAGFALIPPKP